MGSSSNNPGRTGPARTSGQVGPAIPQFRGSRPLSDVAQVKQLRATLGRAAIAKRLGIGRSSVYRALA